MQPLGLGHSSYYNVNSEVCAKRPQKWRIFVVVVVFLIVVDVHRMSPGQQANEYKHLPGSPVIKQSLWPLALHSISLV